MKRFLFVAACFSLTGLVPLASAQDEGFLVTFHFDRLWFKFHPNGLASTETSGSGIEVFAENIRVEGEEVKDLRHCIDGWRDECSYGPGLAFIGYEANRDGMVTSEEVATFTPIALGFAGQIEKVQRLSDTLQSNVTVDGKSGSDPDVVDLVFRAAEGQVNSTTAAYTDVKVEVGYDNDRNSKRHEILVKSFPMAGEGFVYAEVRWTLEGDAKWDYKPGDTTPESFRGRVTKDGWTSGQAEFEDASEQTLKLVVELPKKRTPGFEAFALVGAVALAVLWARRR